MTEWLTLPLFLFSFHMGYTACTLSGSVVSDSLWPHGLKTTNFAIDFRGVTLEQLRNDHLLLNEGVPTPCLVGLELKASEWPPGLQRSPELSNCGSLMASSPALDVNSRNTQVEKRKRPRSQSKWERTEGTSLFLSPAGGCSWCGITEEGRLRFALALPSSPVTTSLPTSTPDRGPHSNRNLPAFVALSTEIFIQLRGQQMRDKLQLLPETSGFQKEHLVR